MIILKDDMIGRLLKCAILTVGFAFLYALSYAQESDARIYVQLKDSVPVMESGRVSHLTEETFSLVVADYKKDKDLYLNDKPCVVDFYATWCKPCKKLSPTIDSLACDYKDSVRFFKVDVAQTPELVKAYGLEFVPTFLFCRGDTVDLVREVEGDFRTYVERYFSE